MTQEAAARTEDASQTLRAPLGTLTLVPGSIVRATLRQAEMDAPPQLPEAGFDGGVCLPWRYLKPCDGHLHLECFAEGFALTPLTTMLPEWRRTPGLYLAMALELADTLGRVQRELDRFSPGRFFLSPAQVFLASPPQAAEPNRHAVSFWRVAPLPLAGATVADFAACSPVVLSWLSAAAVLNSTAPDWLFLVGASLYSLLISELYPADLSEHARFHRLLGRMAGNAERTRARVAAALPRSLGSMSGELSELILTLLSPIQQRNLSPLQMAQRFGQLCERLTAPLLASAWESERQWHYALEVMNLHALLTDPSDVTWNRIAKLRARTGVTRNSEEVEEGRASLNAQHEETPIRRLHRLVAQSPEAEAELEQQIQRMEPDSKTPPGDEEYLYLAYIKGRRLGHPDAALHLLEREFHISWYKVLRLVLMARFSAEMKSWNKILMLCRDARNLLARMPDGGGRNGRYARAYMEGLDGIAHITLVGGGLAPTFLRDAVVKLETTLIALRELEATNAEHASTPALVPGFAAWLLEATRRLEPHPELQLAYVGAAAFAQAFRLSQPANDDGAVLDVPWFDENYLFDL